MSSEKSVAATQEPLPNPSVQQNTNESIQSTGEQEPPSFKFYRPPGSNLTTLRELPDSYFTPSAADLRVLQASLMARSQALSNAPLRTQSMRETEEKSKLARYPTTTIRIRFSDRSQLEKKFSSTDKIRAVYAFVRSSLREDVKPIKFILYQPPKRELKVSDVAVRDLTLFQLELAPSSVLHVKFLDDSLNHENVPAPLDLVILARAEDLPIPRDSDSEPPSGEQTPKPRASTSSGTGSSGRTDKKIPKWLKLGPKK